jgi:hypothetical protein
MYERVIMMKFNRMRVRNASHRPTGTIPCVRWQIDEQTLVEIRHEPVVNSDRIRPGVILDLDWPLADRPMKNRNRKVSLC